MELGDVYVEKDKGVVESRDRYDHIPLYACVKFPPKKKFLKLSENLII